MSERLHIDIESFSEADLKKVGMYAYAEHPSTEVLVLCFSHGHGPVNIWIPAEERDIPEAVIAAVRAKLDSAATLYIQPLCPDVLVRAVESGMELGAHNAGFERTMLNGHAGQRIGFPQTEAKQWVCTAAKARAHGLPGALGDVAKALGSHPKDEDGKADMMRVTKPRKLSKNDPTVCYTPDNAPEKFIKLYSYCADDVRAERDIDKTVPDLSPSERKVWILDQCINDRGVRVDLDAIDNVQILIDEYKKELEAKCLKWTGVKPTQREKIADWIRANGWPHLEDLQAETVNTLVADERVPDPVKRILRLYSTYGMKAVTKYETMKDAACADGRIRGMFIYHGATTGRWSSFTVQLHNLFRPVIKDTLTAIDAFAARSLIWVRGLYS